MPQVALLQIAAGALASKVLTQGLGLTGDERRDVTMCTTFANSGPLPLIFVEALFASGGRGGSRSTAAAAALQADVTACISFYLLAWSPLFWSYGRYIFGTYENSNNRRNNEASSGSAATTILAKVKPILSPPVLGCLWGVLIGGVPVLQRL
jgi:predicted permease